MKPIVFKPFLLLFGLILVVSLACLPTTSTGGPTQPPVEPLPVQPSLPPEVQPNEPPTVSPVAEKFFTEEFDGDTSNWSINDPTISKNDKTADTSTAIITLDASRLFFDIGKNLNVYTFYKPQTYTNVRIDVSVENRGTNDNNINIICRASDEGWYEFSIANNGKFWIYGYEGEKGVYRQLYDGGSNKIKQGKDVNEYSIVCKDRILSLYINGFETRTIEENTLVYRDGMIGIGLSSWKSIPVKVEFDWVKISEP